MKICNIRDYCEFARTCDKAKPHDENECKCPMDVKGAKCIDYDPRYPYTHAADLLRMVIARDNMNCKISREESSIIRNVICMICDLNDEIVAKKLAEYYLKNKDNLSNSIIDKFREKYKYVFIVKKSHKK
jgi:hypothetical protein